MTEWPSVIAYSCTVEVSLDLRRTLELATSPDHLPSWTPALTKVVTVRGERGRPGSVNELHFEGMPGGGVMVERVESVEAVAHHVVYQLGPVTNHQRSVFEELPDGGTRWTAEHTFVLPPVMAEQMGPQAVETFRANTQGTMEAFKMWAEGQSSSAS